MERAGELSAGALLCQGQLRCKPTQLKRPPFQLRMTSFQLAMASAQSLLSLFVYSPLSLFIAACLENLLGTATLCDIQLKTGEPPHLPLSVAIGMAQTF